MSNALTNAKKQIVIDYIKRIKFELSFDEPLGGFQNNIIDLLVEVSNVFQNDIPELQSSLLFRTGTEIRDANTAIALLKLFLANHGVEYDEEADKNVELKRFWSSFILWFENELINQNLLQDKYVRWDNWDGGTLYLELNYDYEFKLHRGISYPDSLKNNSGNIDDIKMFIELAYKHWIINEGKAHYEFTIEVNERLKLFKLPYRLQNGILIKQGYKTTFNVDAILNYRMFERKIKFSEEMINSRDMMEKKSALDFLIDSLQYLVSTQEGKNKKEQYATLSKSVNNNVNSKVYSVVKKELEELMKLSNEYFDIRHNDYLNDAKEHREALNDSQFIEYLYNRAYALLYLLRLKSGNKVED